MRPPGCMLWPSIHPLKENPMVSPRDITALLGDWSRGNGAALGRVLPLVYAELRRVAARQLGTSGPTIPCSQRPLCTRCTCGSSTNAASIGRIERTSLVSPRSSCAGSSSITPVVTAPANGATACARCQSMRPTTWRRRTDARPRVRSRARSVGDDRFELAKIVELRAFGGLTIEEVAHVLSVSPSTIKRDWRTAKAWLKRELDSEVRP